MAFEYQNGPQGDPALWGGLGQILGGLGAGAAGLGLGYMAGPGTGLSRAAQEYVNSGYFTPEQGRVYDRIKNPTEQNAFRAQVMKENERKGINSAVAKEDARRKGLPLEPEQGVPGTTNPMQYLGGPGGEYQRPNISAAESIENLRNAGADPQTLAIQERLYSAEEKNNMRRQEMDTKNRADAWKATAAVRSKETQAYDTTLHMEDVLSDMTKYSESGKMTHPLFLELLSKVGLDFDALKSPETVAYQALEKEFLKDLKGIFGGRISNLEMSTFLKSIPKATNTPEGRKLISDRLKAYYKAKKLRFKTMNKIIEKNGGYPPYDLEEKISIAMGSDKAVKAKEEQYMNQFRGIPKGGELVQDEDTGEYFTQSADGKLTPFKMGV